MGSHVTEAGTHRFHARAESRNETIDAFRGVAILSVLLFHYTVRWAPPWNATNLYGYSNSYPLALGLGALGVHLFFVISGLVITMTVLRSRSGVEFLVRRFGRLYPAFLCGLLLTLTVTTFAATPQFMVGAGDAIANLTMSPGDWHHKPVDGAYWSLAIEIKFYFLVAIAYALLREWFWLGIVAASALGVAAYETGHAETILLVPYAPFFLLGMAIWFGLFERRSRPSLVLFAASLLTYLAFHRAYQLPHLAPWLPHLWILCSVAAFAAILARGGVAGLRPLAGIGRVSYSLYLIHQCIGVVIIAKLTAMGSGDICAFLVASAICVAAAALMFRYVEQPGRGSSWLPIGAPYPAGLRSSGLPASWDSAPILLPGLMPRPRFTRKCAETDMPAQAFPAVR